MEAHLSELFEETLKSHTQATQQYLALSEQLEQLKSRLVALNNQLGILRTLQSKLAAPDASKNADSK